MYIKQVVIEGFKSYREQVATETFSPKVNCIVGANGSGKSNFFHAIRFVISDLFHNLRNEERQALLHEGSGHQVLSAFVEIVFDNSDNRLPVGKEEVRLRRTISFKKDDYFLDGKRIEKPDLMSLLESAGFSRSNPYYVVQQGKIAMLTLMKDSERLDLLKEIGGSRVYEERRRESLKIMTETGKKRRKINQDIQYLDDRLRELDEEKEELKKYQQLDKQRKSLEYAIYDKELHDAKQKLVEIENDRNKISENSAAMYDSVSDAHERSKELDKILKDILKEAQIFNREKETIEKQRSEAIRKRAKLELDDKDLHDRIKANIRAKENAVLQLEHLDKEISGSRAELDGIKRLYDDQVREEENLTRGIMEREKQLSILYQKQGRATQFASKAARDEWLKKEIMDYEQLLSSNLLQERKLREEIQHLEKDIEQQDADIAEGEGKIAKLKSLISGYKQGNDQYKMDRDKLHDERKLLWESENELSVEIGRLKSEVVKAEKSLDRATPGEIRRGLNSVRRITRENNIAGVFGPLIELLDCEDKYFTAVEVTAGNSLYHVVVRDDEISTTIIRHLNAQKGGRVTFIPLNRVKGQHVSDPMISDVEPLLMKLQFSEQYTAAFSQVFGKTVVCPDLDVATRVARNYGLDCITKEGDQVNKRGGMTGGYYDHSRSKLKFMKTVKVKSNSIETKEGELRTVRDKLQEIDKKINAKVADLQKNKADLAHEESVIEQLKQDLLNSKKQKHSIMKSLEKKKKLLSSVLTQIEQNKSNIFMKKDELVTDLVDHLTPEEKESLSRLHSEITNLKEQLAICRSNRIETETRKSEFEINLSTNLVRRKEELEAVKQSTETEVLQGESESKRQYLLNANQLVDQLTQQLKRASESIDQKNKKLEEIKDEKEEVKGKEDKYQEGLQDEANKLEQLLTEKNLYMSKQEEYSKKLRELGPLSSDAFEIYKCKSVKELYQLLDKCNEQLQQFSRVNKQALDQYVNLTEQREECQRRQAESDAGDEKIKELISVLDMRKDESIERTFKGVAKNFREVFAELVQGGHGFLIMMKKKVNNDVDDEPPPKDAEKYIGVKVKVSFTGQGETQSMKQLSGGQKTVVALALIFAIQKCDPAPFYLFDEMDAALDAQYRTAVGNMVRRQADTGSTQFITTTFRPELVKVADKIYGVTHKNSLSHVDVVTKDEALDFIEHDQSHNE